MPRKIAETSLREREKKDKFFSWNGLIGHITWIEVIQRLIAEFLGTAILVIVGCWAAGMDMYITVSSIHLIVVLSFGFAVMMIVEIVGHISLACVNPTVTLTFVVLGIIKPGLGLLYWCVQFIGAIAGAIVIYGMAKRFRENPSFCCNKLNDDISVIEGFFFEMFATGILNLVVCGAFDERNKDKFDSIAIKFGLAVMVLALATGPYTSAGINPARAFGSAIIANYWKHHWLYWAGPFSGSLVVSVFYKYTFFLPPKKEEKEDKVDKIVDDTKTNIEEEEEIVA